MNHDILDAASYAWRTKCLNRPDYTVKQETSEILGKVTAVEYTSDKDHSSGCVYVNLNFDGSEWIDKLKEKADLEARARKLWLNSFYGMHADEKPIFDREKYLYFNNGEECKMSKAENEYIAKKNLLKVEQAEKENELKMKYDTDLIELRREYSEKFEELEKEKENAKNNEKADAHAKAVKAAYDAYLAQGFTKTQAENFIKIALENK